MIFLNAFRIKNSTRTVELSIIYCKMSKKTDYEFGGPKGSIGIMIFSHVILYLLYHLLGVENWMPNTFTVATYVTFIFIEAVFAYILPGVWMQGLTLTNCSGEKYNLRYLCNGLCSWYCTLVMLAMLHVFGYFDLCWITDNIGRYMTTSIICANFCSVIIYVWGLIMDDAKVVEQEILDSIDALNETLTKLRAIDVEIPQSNIKNVQNEIELLYQQLDELRYKNTLTGNHTYDFFMGSILNPRIGILDLKMFAEIRISWMLLFLITTANMLKQYQEYGYISNSMFLIWIAQTLYTNACMKGEECIPTTWDIFHEKFGWMLIFWNLSGVPFLYAVQSYYIYTYDISLGRIEFCILLCILGIAYYIWDTANSQKNRFRMQRRGTLVQRPWAFPQFSIGTLENPETIRTETSEILIDGWWAVARKVHYTADLMMALIWGLSCGFGSFIPYFYFCFFLTHLLHRAFRDDERCRKKYKDYWVQYCDRVPYMFIPYVY